MNEPVQIAAALCRLAALGEPAILATVVRAGLQPTAAPGRACLSRRQGNASAASAAGVSNVTPAFAALGWPQIRPSLLPTTRGKEKKHLGPRAGVQRQSRSPD